MGRASGTVINGGTEIVNINGSELSAAVNSGGFLLVNSRGFLASATISSGLVEVASSLNNGSLVSFASGGGGTVQFDSAVTEAFFGVFVSGFALGDFIDFRAVGFTSGATSATWAQSGPSGTLTVSSGSTSANISLIGQYMTTNFTLSSDLHGGTVVAYQPVVPQTDLLTNPHST
jgi:autotransporter passenger strand-loop-strand repeat protein